MRDRTRKRTPLHYAALADAADIARLLLQHGAEAGAVDSGSATPMDLVGVWVLPSGAAFSITRLSLQLTADVH